MNMTKRPIAPVLEGIAAAQQANLPIKIELF
jgi:cyclic pyranopterin phosphate synthase